jgi:hypothetical protein
MDSWTAGASLRQLFVAIATSLVRATAAVPQPPPLWAVSDAAVDAGASPVRGLALNPAALNPAAARLMSFAGPPTNPSSAADRGVQHTVFGRWRSALRTVALHVPISDLLLLFTVRSSLEYESQQYSRTWGLLQARPDRGLHDISARLRSHLGEVDS